MKRLLIALAAAVAALTASAIITGTQNFESGRDGFVAADSEEDASEVVTYASTETAKPNNSLAPYPLQGADNDASFGDSYFSLDTGDTTVWRTNTVEGNVYFDMTMQFTPSQSAPELEAGTKIAVYQDAASSNIVVLAGPVVAGDPTEYVVGQINPGTWGRLSVSAVQGAEGFTFKVYLNGTELSTSGESPVSEFPSLTADTTIDKVGFAGTGKLDDFVARTTDPFIQNPAAMIGGEGYASLEDALEDATAESVIELCANHAQAIAGLAAGTTYKIRKGEYTFGGFTVSGETVLTESTVDGVTTYAAVAGVAAVTHSGTTTWYATFAEAYDAANAITTGDYPVLTIKVESDFTPAITYSQFFQQIKIESTTESPVTVNLKNVAGTYTMTAVGYQASANVTLVLPADLVAVNNAYLTGGCTVEVPEGVTLTLAPGSSGTLSNIGGLVGAGTLVAPTDPGALYNFIANATYSSWLKADTWTGTLQCSGDMTTVNYGILFDNITNANASVRFSGFTNYVHNATSASVFEAIELVGDGLTLAGEYSSAATYTFTNALKGDGALNVAVTGGGYGNALKTIKFTGDVSGFGGSITFTDGATYKTHDVLIFGSDSSTVSNAVVVSAGVVMTNATGKTWNVPGGVVVNGSLVANGTVTTAAELDGSGVYEVNASTAAIKVANTWTGTYNANFKAANNAIFYIPVNAAATTVINGANGEFGGYPNFGGAAPTIAGEVVLNANWTIANGWAGDGNVTTFAELSGSGNLTVDGTTSGTDPIYYTITELDNYAGTIGGARGAFTIGKVNVTDQPTNGALVVKTAIGANGSIGDNVPLYVGGTNTQKTLTYVADGAEGAGLYYVVAPSPSGFDGGDGATFSIPAETQSALEAKLPSGKTLADVVDATSGMTYAQAYALGLMNETTGAVEDLKATIEVVDGKVKVSLDDATAGAAYTVTLKVYEKASLSAEWPAAPTATYALGNEGEGFTPGSATAGFYKVEVSIANK